MADVQLDLVFDVDASVMWETAIRRLGDFPVFARDVTPKGPLHRGPGGETPHATLYSAILRDLTAGDAARFVKTERGRFAVRS